MDEHLPWLIRVAHHVKKRQSKSVELSDLLSDGYIGLVAAKRLYQPGRNTSFEGFAYRRVVGSMLDGLRERSRPLLIRWTEPKVAERSRDQLMPLLNRLDRIQRLTLHLHYLEGLTLKLVGECFDVSEARACQLHRTALKLVRAQI